jgi:hypothetical protein
LTVTRLRVSLPLTFSALVPRRLAVAAARFPLGRIPGLPIAVRLASISLVTVEVAIDRVGTVRRWCALRTGRLTIGNEWVVAIIPSIASAANSRSLFTGLLTIVGTIVNGTLRALAKFRACGLR